MDNSTTRIADLPSDNNAPGFSNQMPPATVSITNTKPSKMDGDMQTNYKPINTHPNPYGISAQNPIMDTPQMSGENASQNIMMTQQDAGLPREMMDQLQNMGHQRLPARDIPQDQVQYSNDEQVQPNYIPKPNREIDYVRDHHEMTEEKLHEFEALKRREANMDNLLTSIQTPILVAILFFFFQLPIMNTLIFKRFSFLSLYDSDGNFNLTGLILKSISFGSMYYSLQSITNFISTL